MAQGYGCKLSGANHGMLWTRTLTLPLLSASTAKPEFDPR